MTPAFSIVVPCYRVAGRGALLRECLRSIAAQTLADYEVLLIDDGSPDASVPVIEALLAEEDAALAGRARLIALARNGGVSLARNAGIDAARGTWVAFLDFDDLWHPRHLESMQAALLRPPVAEVALARTDFLRTLGGRRRVRATDSLLALEAMDWPDFCAWHLLHNFPVAMGSAVVVRRALFAERPVLRFDEWLSRRTAEDVLFGFQLLAEGIRPRYVDEALCVHRSFLETESRGLGAFLRLDEKEVVDYIARVAGQRVYDAVVRERPQLEPALAACWRRLDREFALKRSMRQPGRLYGLLDCLASPRLVRTWLRLVLVSVALGSPLAPWLREYLFRRGGDDPVARGRVERLLAQVGV